MKLLAKTAIAVAVLGASAAQAASLTSNYTQDFSSLGATGTALPDGWTYWTAPGDHDWNTSTSRHR